MIMYSLLLLLFSVAKNTRSVQENLLKLQRDREFLQNIVSESMTEITSTGTFTALSSHVKKSHEEKIDMEKTILKFVIRKHCFLLY